MSETTQMVLTWEQFHEDTRLLGQQLAVTGPWDGVIAVARGGLVPAAIIAYMLGIRSVDTVCISSYSDETQAKTSDIEVLKELAEKKGRYIAVDDLVDTGETAKMVRRLVPSACIACVYAKPLGITFTDLFARQIPQDTWVIFPWE